MQQDFIRRIEVLEQKMSEFQEQKIRDDERRKLRDRIISAAWRFIASVLVPIVVALAAVWCSK